MSKIKMFKIVYLLTWKHSNLKHSMFIPKIFTGDSSGKPAAQAQTTAAAVDRQSSVSGWTITGLSKKG